MLKEKIFNINNITKLIELIINPIASANLTNKFAVFLSLDSIIAKSNLPFIIVAIIVAIARMSAYIPISSGLYILAITGDTTIENICPITVTETSCEIIFM